MVKGIGVDLVNVKRIDRIYNKWGSRFLHKVFTLNEIIYSQGKSNISQHLAGRFAAKEAVLKMLGTGLRGVSWQDIEVIIDDYGKPEVVLSGNAERMAKKLGITRIYISLSHEEEYAIAQVIGEG